MRNLPGATGIFIVRQLRVGRLSPRGCDRISPGPTHIGEGAAVTDQLLSAIGDMRAQSRQEVERGDDAGLGSFGIAAPPMLPAIVDDLAVFRAIAQAIGGWTM